MGRETSESQPGRDDGETDSSAPLLELTQVTKVFSSDEPPVTALNGIDLALNEAEFLALHGPSGSGKTTFLHVAAALTAPTSGSVRFAGRSIGDAEQSELLRLRRFDFGFVFQFFNLVGELTVVENIALPLVLRGDARSDAAEKAKALARAVGLKHRESHLAKNLSGGEAQRTAVARALSPNPKILFADEPTGNLDQASGSQVLELLREQCSERAVALMIATHDVNVVEQADRVVELVDGVIVSAESPRDRLIGEVTSESM